MSSLRRTCKYRRKERQRVHSDEQVLHHRRCRARERQAMARGEDMPLRDAPWMRWDLWSWD